LKIALASILLVLTILTLSGPILAQTEQKHRAIILTDIEADPDDTQSLVRLFLYSNQIELQGLVATTSCWLRDEINPDSIEKVIRAYAKVRTNLSKHEQGYPSAKALSRLVKRGKPVYGMLGVGKGHDTEGSNWIIKTLEQKDERPLWVSVWGGVNTLAQALYKIKETKSEVEAKRLISKLRVYTISDQDDSGVWIRNNFPDLFYIVTPGDHYASATWTGINAVVEGINNEKISNAWFAEHVQQDHGPLGSIYPDVSWGVEGDTPAYLSLIPNGLNNAERPDWGGWGGRYKLYKPEFSLTKKGGSIVTLAPETRAIWTNAIDRFSPHKPQEYGRAVVNSGKTFMGYKETLWRWRDEFQNDFAARMDWTIKPYSEANHPPIPALAHPEQLSVESGESIRFDASPSSDPDGDSLSFLWFHYPEAGTYNTLIKMDQPENAQRAHVTVPDVEQVQSAHFILKVTDKGSPQLTRYKRIILTIKPKQKS